MDHGHWLISSGPHLGGHGHCGRQGSARGCSRRDVDGEADIANRSRDLRTSTRAIRSQCKIVFTSRKTGGTLSPKQRAETVRRCEGSSWCSPNIHQQFP